MMLHNPRNILGLDGDGWLRNITVNDAIVGLAILQSGAGAGLTIANAGGVKATITAAGKARFGDATAPTVSLEAANGLAVAAGDLTLASGSNLLLGGGIRRDGSIDVKNVAGTAWQQVNLGTLQIASGIYVAGASNLSQHDSATFNLQGRDTSGAQNVTVARMVPHAGNPMFEFTKAAILLRQSGDYGGDFASYTPPTGREGAMIVAEDTNVGTPGRRIYVYSGGAWRYVALS